MNPQTKSALVSAFRTILSVLTGWFFASQVASPAWAAGLDLTSVIIVAAWSYLEKADTAQSAFSMLMGPLRNFAASLVTYASTRGWLTPDQAQQLLPAMIAIAVALWGVEQKMLTVKAKAIVPFLIVGIGAMALWGCAGSVSVGGSDAQITIYNLGEDAVPIVQGLSIVPALPAQACTAAKAADTAFVAAEQIAITGVGSNRGRDRRSLTDAVTALGQIALEVGISTLRKGPGAPQSAHLAATAADPTPAQWQALNNQLAAAVAGLHC